MQEALCALMDTSSILKLVLTMAPTRASLRILTAVPYIGCMTLSDNQQEYNGVHGFYCARVEHLFASLWHWRIVCGVWMGFARDLHQHVRILLHDAICTRRQTRHQPYGPWPHVLESMWAQQDACEDVEANDDGACCQLGAVMQIHVSVARVI